MRQGPAGRLTSAGTGVQMPKAPPKRKGRGRTAAQPREAPRRLADADAGVQAPPVPEQVLTRRWPPSSMALRERASAGERTRVCAVTAGRARALARACARRLPCVRCANLPLPTPVAVMVALCRALLPDLI
jgi:hypothetical protein